MKKSNSQLKHVYCQRELKMNNQRKIALSEIFLTTMAIIAFSFIMGQALPEVSASAYVPTGCCLEDLDGGVCLDMLESDESLCASNLVGTDCSQVESCQQGCCYDSDYGTCTLNSPKSPCEDNGGTWTDSEACSIDECELGCCILGSQAISSTSRECTNLAAEYGFEKEFSTMDASGTCQDYADLAEKGACVSDTGDYSGELDCVFTEKGSCNDEFYKGKLCTDPDLETLCVPSQDTSCIEGEDEVYYLDSCGNQANVYDSSKLDDDDYWTDIIEPSDSCSTPSADCGNCDYISGSICSEANATDYQATYGDYICRDLNCGGPTHGESWCIYDYSVNSIAPVGTRHFVASCLEGEINLEGCADFNQEICIQTTSNSSGNTYARCYTNDWRSCINANGEGDYDDVEESCSKLSQCMMFNDYWGEESVKVTDGTFLAGFNPELLNSEQGAAGDVGAGSNTIIPFCIPKYTPGFQFWNEESSDSAEIGSGGSETETDYICSLASFSCTSRQTRRCTLAGGCGDWRDQENWECNVDGKSDTIKTQDMPQWMASVNERCRALGTCGTNIGLSGEFGFDEGFSLMRLAIDKTGDVIEDLEVEEYILTATYGDHIKSSSGLVALGSLDASDIVAGLDIESSGSVSEEVEGGLIDYEEILGQAPSYNVDKSSAQVAIELGSGLVMTSLMFPSVKSYLAGGFSASGFVSDIAMSDLPGVTATGAESSFNLKGGITTLAVSIVASFMGYQIGSLIAENQDWSPGKQEQFIGFMASATVAVTDLIIALLVPKDPILWFIGAIIAAILAIFTAFDSYEDTQYYILQFNCEGWEAASGGDCQSCGEDARPCSEYRCRSIGANCMYYDDLGDPGTCASISDTWQAIIEPWGDILSEGNVYGSIKDSSFEIFGSEANDEVKSWEQLIWGISTDKEASCKIDTEHTDDYFSMSYDMTAHNRTHHYVTMSQFGESGAILMEEGENELYIRCMNFAGEINEAEFAVQFTLSDEPDLTPPMLSRYDPENNGYLKYGENSTDLYVYMNEPSECRINNGFDSNFDSMETNMSCITSPSLGYNGEWACYTELTSLVNNENTFYIKCLDKPGENESEVDRMLSQTYIYTINQCDEGLEIASLEPQDEEILTNSSGLMTLEVETDGCINGGESYCYYDFGSGDIAFLDTNSTTHEQVFNSLGSGDYEIEVYCIDEAGNEDTAYTNISVTVDQNAPELVRVYTDANTLYVRTDEPARCVISENQTEEECDLEISQSVSLTDLSTFTVSPTGSYFIQCEDDFGNKDLFCQEVQIVN